MAYVCIAVGLPPVCVAAPGREDSIQLHHGMERGAARDVAEGQTDKADKGTGLRPVRVGTMECRSGIDSASSRSLRQSAILGGGHGVEVKITGGENTKELRG